MSILKIVPYVCARMCTYVHVRHLAGNGKAPASWLLGGRAWRKEEGECLIKDLKEVLWL